jgi:hypothetical protein
MNCGILISGILLLAACHTKTLVPESKEPGPVKDSVRLLLTNLQNGLSQQGPIVWLNYFDQSPDFYMATEGQIAFKDYPVAKQFIETILIKKISTIHLTFNQLRIDSLSTALAVIGTGFHEDLTDSTGLITHSDGYLTALARQTADGWKLENLHWSILK